jgi:hypothetical protein
MGQKCGRGNGLVFERPWRWRPVSQSLVAVSRSEIDKRGSERWSVDDTCSWLSEAMANKGTVNRVVESDFPDVKHAPEYPRNAGEPKVYRHVLSMHVPRCSARPGLGGLGLRMNLPYMANLNDPTPTRVAEWLGSAFLEPASQGQPCWVIPGSGTRRGHLRTSRRGAVTHWT